MCSVISCKVLQISIGRWGRIIHNMFMRTGVCQSQGQVVHPRVCARVRERFTTPSSLSLSVSLSTPWQHFLGEHTQYKMLEHFHKHTRTTAFVKGDGRSRAVNTGWCRAAQRTRVAVTPLGNPPSFVSSLRLQFLFQFIPLFPLHLSPAHSFSALVSYLCNFLSSICSLVSVFTLCTAYVNW